VIRKTLVLALAIAACGSPPASKTPTTSAPSAKAAKRIVVMLSRKSGTSAVTPRADGGLDIAYEHLENGRGPKMSGHVKLAADGTIAEFEAHGHHTMGTPIDETFSIQGKHAKWSSHEEKGEKDLTGPAFYVPIAPLPDAIGMLFTALQKAGGKIALLPDGEARLERSTETTLKGKKLVGWAITGLDLTPQRLWTEEDGTFLGIVDNWYSCIAEGWEDAIDPLVAIQLDLDRKRDAEIATKAAHKSPVLAFAHAKVLDVEKGKWIEDQTVVVEGGKISSVGKTPPPKGAEVIDATGKTMLPGLWDMHSHLGQPDGVLDIASGVTTARDLGNDPDRLDDYKKRFDDGLAVGPHVLRSGFIEGRGEKAAASKITAETEDEAKSAVDFYSKRGYEGIKIYNSMKPELVPVLAKLAHEKGMRVSGHIPVHMRAEEAVRAGYDEIQHVNMLFLNFFIDKDTDTRTTLRFSIVAEKGAGLDLASKPVKDFFGLLLEKKTVVDPTVNAFEDLFLGRPGEILPDLVPVASRLPVQLQRQFKTGGLPVPEGKDDTYKQSFAKLLTMVKALHDAKIPIVSGTDSIAGLMLHHELSLYAKAGIPNADILRIASLDAARVMKLDKQTGSIEKGKVADFFLVDGDPLANIDDLRKITTTLRGGVRFESADLYPAVGVR
jgi:cytosine/adenosine deaminase-related metal-dependent hydrolase